MKNNPMLAHFERESAKKNALKQANDAKAAQLRNNQQVQRMPTSEIGNTADEPTSESGNIELRFYADQQRLKTVQSELAKRELKAELLPKYLPWIEGTLTISPAPQNDLLVWLMVWAIDARNYQLAFTIASHCLLNNMVMPEPFTRDIATVFAEQMSDGILEDTSTAGNFADIIEQVVEMLKSFDIVDQVRAKLYKAYGISIQTTRATDALTAYETALRLSSNIGVKKLIETLKRAIKHADTPSAPDTQSGSQKNEASQDTSITSASTALPIPENAVNPATESLGVLAALTTEGTTAASAENAQEST